LNCSSGQSAAILREDAQLRGRHEGLDVCERIAHARDRSLGQELEHLLRGFAETLQQGPRACIALLWRIHHVHQLLGGPPKLLQLPALLLILLAQSFDLLKAIDELRSVSPITFCSLSTSSVRRYSIFFTSVSNSSLCFVIFLSSVIRVLQHLMGSY
jgi:hypothetical protein